jgi:hypothetical protein
MIWQSVESSQIEQVGYDPETATLGIRFKPTKKQAENGERGSEYHYANVEPKLHAALLAAESVGSYFGREIKPYPNVYPFTKVS